MEIPTVQKLTCCSYRMGEPSVQTISWKLLSIRDGETESKHDRQILLIMQLEMNMLAKPHTDRQIINIMDTN